ncbi:MAG TPA: hypothetical protein DCQ99_08115 [Nitrospinae bacterium]|nr:hypothetical protein [Nitrospinota bacterium]HBA27042.1 hypothetical protein [Nitrospinota bacterium]
MLYLHQMKHDDRRREIGKMLIKVVEYLITIALIGKLLTEKVTVPVASSIIITGCIVLVIAFFMIPPNREK